MINKLKDDKSGEISQIIKKKRCPRYDLVCTCSPVGSLSHSRQVTLHVLSRWKQTKPRARHSDLSKTPVKQEAQRLPQGQVRVAPDRCIPVWIFETGVLGFLYKYWSQVMDDTELIFKTLRHAVPSRRRKEGHPCTGRVLSYVARLHGFEENSIGAV